MLNFPINHREFKENTLLAGRLVYKEKFEATSGAIDQSEKLQQAIDTHYKDLKLKKAASTKAVNDYKKKGHDLKIDIDNPDSAIASIKGVLIIPVSIGSNKYTLATSPGSDHRAQADALRNLLKLLEAQKAVAKKLKEAVDSKLGKLKGFISAHEDIAKIQRTATTYGERPYFHQYNTDYKQVFDNILSGRDSRFNFLYKSLFDKQAGNKTIDVYKEKEARKLFLSILSQETDGFRKPFPIKGFSDTWQDNRKNFPYLYKKYIDRQAPGLNEKVKGKNLAIEAKAKELGAEHLNGQALKTKIENEVLAINLLIKNNSRVPNRFEISTAPLDAVKGQRGKFYYLALMKAVAKIKTQIGDYQAEIKKLNIPDTTNFAQNKLKPLIDRLSKYGELTELNVEKADYQAKIENASKDFNLAKLSNPKYKQIVLELMMFKFQKAMKLVDQPFQSGGTTRGSLHPDARRMLIAMIYKKGVARFEQGKYFDDMGDEYTGIITKLRQSPHFNPNFKMRRLTDQQREFLLVAYTANEADLKVQYLQSKLVEPLKKLSNSLLEEVTLAKTIGKKRLLATKPKEEEEVKKLEKKLKDLKAKNKKLKNLIEARLKALPNRDHSPIKSKKQIDNLIKYEEGQIKNWKKLQASSATALKDPSKISALIEKLKTAKDSFGLETNNAKEFASFSPYMNKVAKNFRIFNHEDRASSSHLEKLGIHTDGIYQAYIVEIGKPGNEDLKMSNWNVLLRDKKGVKRLRALFEQILPPSTAFKGRNGFLLTLDTLHTTNSGSKIFNKAQIYAFATIGLIKSQLKHQEKLVVASKRKDEQVMHKLEGMTLIDRGVAYGRGVFRMLVGPGQSLANRGAAAILLIAAWKLAKKAYKGEDKSGKALRVAFLAIAAELALKHTTGEGITDKMRLTGLTSALKGTHEHVLLDRGEKTMSITQAEHARTLVKMRHVPMADLMTFYKNTDSGGNALPGKKSEGRLPGGLDAHDLVSGSVTQNKDSHARLMLKETMRNFFGYIGGKDQKGEVAGQKIIEEIYITSVKNRNYKLNKAIEARRGLPPNILRQARLNPRFLTWQMIMYNEIRPIDEQKARERLNSNLAKNYLKKQAEAISRWTRQDIFENANVIATNFWESVQTRHAPAIKDFLARVGDAAGRNLRYGVNSIYFMYEGNKYELRKFAGDTWAFFGNVAALPFKVFYGVHQKVVPFVNLKIRQTIGVLQNGSFTSLGPNETLSQRNVMGNNLTENSPLKDWFDLKKNPNFLNFGMYQSGFSSAIEKSGGRYPAHYISRPYTNPRIATLEGMPGNHFMIMRTTPDEAGVGKNDSSQLARQKMRAKIYEKTVRYFMARKNMKQEEVIKYLSKIHEASRSPSGTGRAPQEMFGFFRFPGGRELELKRSGQWKDYYKAERHKFMPPFMADPTKGILENLWIIYGGREPHVREGVSRGGVVIGQWMRLMMGVVNVGGQVAKLPVGGLNVLIAGINKALGKAGMSKIPGIPTKWLDTLRKRDEKMLQAIDELTWNARNPSFSSSRFYKKKKNSLIFRRAWEIAKDKRSRINLIYDESGPKDANGQYTKRWPWAGKRLNVPDRTI